jgi:hypothetical protein
MRKILMGAVLGLALASMAACSTVGRTVSTVGGAVYADASSALSGYCSLTPGQRAVAQLVVAGKAYNTGICDVVNGDTTLDAKLSLAAQEKAAQLIDQAITKAVADGRLTQEQADLIQSLRAAPKSPAGQPGAVPSEPPTKLAIGAEEAPVPGTVAQAIETTRGA